MAKRIEFITTADGTILARCLMTGAVASGLTESEAAAELQKMQSKRAA